MCSATSFFMQIANLCIEICGYDDEDSACLRDLKRIFRHHEVCGDETATHRVVVCAPSQFEIPPETTLRWVAPCLGVSNVMPRRRFPFFARIFARNKEIPRYSGTCNVICYKDKLHQVEYFISENAEWRIKHVANEHVTYVYSDRHSDMSDGLTSLLIHVIGSQYGCYLLYASCVAIGGEALLFAGNSGVGKSTLCMELIKQGASYIGDDLVLLYLKGKQAMVGSMLFPVKCYADKIRSHKKTVDVVSDLPQHQPLNAPLKNIYLLRRSESAEGKPCLKPIPGEKMFEMMLTLTNKANTNADARHFIDTISYICGSVPCYYLPYDEYYNIIPLFFADNDRR